MALLSERPTPQDVSLRLHTALAEIGLPRRGRMKQTMIRFDWTQSQASKTLSGKQFPTIEMCIDLFRHSQINVNWLVTGYGAMFYRETAEDETEQMIWEVINDTLEDLEITANNARRVEIFNFVKRQLDRGHAISRETIEDFVLSTGR